MLKFLNFAILIAKSQNIAISIAKFQKYCNTLQYYWNHSCLLNVKDSFTSTPIIISCFWSVSLLMNWMRWIIVSYEILLFTCSWLWIKNYCCVIAVWTLVGSIGVTKTLYTELIVECRPSRPWSVIHDHQQSLWLSSPLLVVIRDHICSSTSIKVPLGL